MAFGSTADGVVVAFVNNVGAVVVGVPVCNAFVTFSERSAWVVAFSA